MRPPGSDPVPEEAGANPRRGRWRGRRSQPDEPSSELDDTGTDTDWSIPDEWLSPEHRRTGHLSTPPPDQAVAAPTAATAPTAPTAATAPTAPAAPTAPTPPREPERLGRDRPPVDLTTPTDDRLSAIAGELASGALGFVSRHRTRVIAGTVAFVLIVVGWQIWSSRPVDTTLAAATPSPLGLVTLQLPEGCTAVPVSEEEVVRLAAVQCPLRDGAGLSVVEIDFGQARAEDLDPRFLADSMLASGRPDWTGTAADRVASSATDLGTEVRFQGRATIEGEPSQTVGHVLINGNWTVMVVAHAPERDAVSALEAQVVDSMAAAAG